MCVSVCVIVCDIEKSTRRPTPRMRFFTKGKNSLIVDLATYSDMAKDT